MSLDCGGETRLPRQNPRTPCKERGQMVELNSGPFSYEATVQHAAFLPSHKMSGRKWMNVNKNAEAVSR